MADKKIIIDRYCPKCISNRVYVDDDFYACRECGNRWIPNFKPITKIMEDESMPKKVQLDDEKLKTEVSDGKTFQEIMQSMGATRSTLDRNLKRLGLKPIDGRAVRDKKPSARSMDPDKLKAGMARLKEKVRRWPENGKSNHSSDDSDMSSIIGSIDVKIEFHKSQIDKLNQAKQILI